jgi:membrane protease YdiL (CAAX protease family)
MKPIIATESGKVRIFYLFFFSLVGMFVAGGIRQFFSFVFGFDDPSNVWFIRLNTFLQSLLMFFFPAYAVAGMSESGPLRFLRLQRSSNLFSGIGLAVLIFIVAMPMVSFLMQWNEQMHLPESFKSIEQWMRQMEDAAAATTEILLEEKSVGGLMVNLLLIGVFAAFSEEFFFRGVLQQSLAAVVKNEHAAIWITAFLFSVMHLQFYGFFPRLVLGVLLGYLFLYGRNLWIPIAAHFFNNALSILTVFFFSETDFMQRLENQPLTFAFGCGAALSLMVTLFLFLLYKKRMEDVY